MGPDQFVAGRALHGGITYGGLEALNVHLGHGSDTFTIETTHIGTTRVTAATRRGDGDRRPFYVRTIDGHTTIEGRAATTPSRVGTRPACGAGTIDLIAALLAIDGGAGNDTVTVDDTADTHARPRLADADDPDRPRHGRPHRHRPRSTR